VQHVNQLGFGEREAWVPRRAVRFHVVVTRGSAASRVRKCGRSHARVRAQCASPRVRGRARQRRRAGALTRTRRAPPLSCSTLSPLLHEHAHLTSGRRARLCVREML
jgi:hypothetical protein